MVAITVRNISEATHRALKLQAAEHGRSTEAEIRSILEAAARPGDRLKLGSALVALFRPLGGVNLDIARDPAASPPIVFE